MFVGSGEEAVERILGDKELENQEQGCYHPCLALKSVQQLQTYRLTAEGLAYEQRIQGMRFYGGRLVMTSHRVPVTCSQAWGTHLAKRARAKANLILQPPENSLMITDSH